MTGLANSRNRDPLSDARDSLSGATVTEFRRGRVILLFELNDLVLLICLWGRPLGSS
jgi:hypothetical protein